MPLASLALLHPLSGGLSAWTIHWSTVVGLAALGAVYAWRARVGPSMGEPRDAASPSATQKAAFLSGLAVLFLSLNGPLHDLSDSYLFSAHMVQHLLLTMLVTPLMIAGTPGWMLRPALRSRAVAAVARRITNPVFCFLAFSLTLTIWHLPLMYNQAMAHHNVHIVQHLCFLVASTLMWWPLMSPMPELPRLSYPKQMLYVVLLTLPMTLVSVYITYADAAMYPAYAAAPRLFGLTPVEDQQMGGLIMWIPGGLVFIAVMTIVFFKWAAAESDDVGASTASLGPTP